MLGTIPEEITMDFVDEIDILKVKDHLHIPLDATCYIVHEDQITIARSKIVNDLMEFDHV